MEERKFITMPDPQEYQGSKPPSSGLRNVLIIVSVMAIIIIILVTWQLSNANNRAAQAEALAAELLEELLELRDLAVIIYGLEGHIAQLEANITQLHTENAMLSSLLKQMSLPVGEPQTLAADQAGPRTYTVQAGDTGLIAIAASQLGDGSRWREILPLNNLPEDFIMREGQVLILPD